jgi:uncharacterized protein with HEPN domain
MPEKRRDEAYLKDIREAMQRILTYTESLSYEAFMQDIRTQDAVIRNLEVIGEATKNLSFALRDAHSHIPWRSMAGMRDRLIHDYFGINYDIVWTVAENEVPGLLPQIERILTEMEDAD